MIPLIPVISALTMALAPSAAAAATPTSSTTTVGMSEDAWFQPNPLCTAQLGCLLPVAPPAQNTFGAGTMSVQVTAGMEEARAYLTPAALPQGVTISKLVLTVPLDTVTTTDGSLSPETAKIKVCTTTETYTQAEGSYATAPIENCATAVPLTYVAPVAPATTPTMTADITAFAGALQFGGTSLALLPDDVGDASKTWHVVFSGHARVSPPVPAPTIAVTTTATAASPSPAAVASPSAGAQPSKAAARTSSAAVAPPHVVIPPPATDPVTTLPSVPQEAAPAPVVAQPQVAPQAQQPQLVPVSRTVVHRFQYPALLLVPLVLVVGAVVVGRQLMRDVVPPEV